MEAASPGPVRAPLLWVAALLAIGLGCPEPRQTRPEAAAETPEPSETLSPDARPEAAEAMRRDLESPRHPADGAGRAWIANFAPVEPGFPSAPAGDQSATAPAGLRAGSRARFDLVFEAGPLGVAEGGRVLLQVSPFWGWDTPQTEVESAPGYTEVRTDASGVELQTTTLAETLLGIEIGGRALAAGERIEVRYGAGPLGARVDRYSEREERIWFAVDGDGDGIRGLLQDSPSIDIQPASPAHLILTLPTTARAGDPISLHVAVLDAVGNAGIPYHGSVRLIAPEGLEAPRTVEFEAAHRGRRSVEVRAQRDGVYRVRGEAEAAYQPLEARSNPVVVRSEVQRILWADLHGHSGLSDGTGTPEDYLSYARDVAGLDIVALTDHDHWGMKFLDASPELWDRIRAATRAAHAPGDFVTLLGFEWTSWLHGHRHVLYFGDDGSVISSIDPATETPAQLWSALRGQPALTFAHHSAGGPIATNWAYPPDPVLEPLTEIVSVHGSSEADDSPGLIYGAVRGNFVRDALDRGYVLGFIGSGDSHDGHPGLAYLSASGGAGLAAILSEEKTREGVLTAMRRRHVYATNGARIWLRVSLDGHSMGDAIAPPTAAAATEHEISIEVVGTGEIERIDLISGGAGKPGQTTSIDTGGRDEWSGRLSLPRLSSGQYLYVRVIQQDGGAAWSSPFFAR